MPDRPSLDLPPLRALPAVLRRALSASRGPARDALHQRLRLLLLVRDAYEKLYEEERAFQQIRTDFARLLRLLHTWADGRYPRGPWKSLLYASAAVLYFVAPADLIPDALPVVGLVDDAAVVTAVVKALRHDLAAFAAWEEREAPARTESGRLESRR